MSAAAACFLLLPHLQSFQSQWLVCQCCLFPCAVARQGLYRHSRPRVSSSHHVQSYLSTVRMTKGMTQGIHGMYMEHLTSHIDTPRLVQHMHTIALLQPVCAYQLVHTSTCTQVLFFEMLPTQGSHHAERLPTLAISYIMRLTPKSPRQSSAKQFLHLQRGVSLCNAPLKMTATHYTAR